MTERVACVAVGAIALSALSGLAQASPITYDFSSGEITLSAVNSNNGNSYLASGTELILSGGTLTFDPVAGTVNSFDFLAAGPQTFTLTGALTGDTVTISSLSLQPGSGYSTASWSGSNPYNYSVDPVTASGMYSVNGGTATSLSKTTSTPLTGSITTASDEVQLTGITLAQASVKSTPVTISGSVTFYGVTAVPLPAGLWLMLSGLGLLAPAIRRRLPLLGSEALT